MHPDDLPGIDAAFAKLFRKGRHTIKYRFLKKEGGYCWVSDEWRLINDEHGPAHVVGSWSDVTPRKDAEAAAAKARERINLLLARSPAVIYSFKATGDYGRTGPRKISIVCLAMSRASTSRTPTFGSIAFIPRIAIA